MTPNDIEILLHYYTTPEPHERVSAPAVIKAIKNFRQRGILEDSDNPSGLRVSEKGEKLVEMLCETPDPINVWIDPRSMNKED